ncbi:TonB-dependent receptor [Roseomonas xinghualingensis]|uniref:TonB-dependent receptor n=1 Tax=Roseomonas xinghualingensis TaxID=2986475 RepID=UPI0021F0E30F|nr:TonB-dependent siderophore receptor [Roseomonas sp. SXEYE001]MCV4206566.1 TonB-dependent siderophore receptor [Roseomonas sp. SXEYE001]
MSRDTNRALSAPNTAPNTALVAGLSLGAAMVGGMAFADPSFAQTAAPGTAAAPVAVPEVSVTGARPTNQLVAPTGNPRLPGTIQETPQTITVVPQEVLREQTVTTLEQALRNVPGITSTIGEGNGGVSGDQFRIRGFSSQNDLLVDGLRDFGSYQRDTFTYEDVQVLKGASGFAFGTSAIGGGININTKAPTLENRYAATATGGMGPFARFTADINQRVSETIAMRLNVMGQSSSLVDRDDQDTRRWGIAPSIAFGLGTPTTFTVDYLHYEDRHTIDGGMPIVYARRNAIGRPASEYGVRRSNWYGIQNDEDDVTVDRLTARFAHSFGGGLSITNDTRLTRVDRTTAITAATCGTNNASNTAYANSCSGQFFNRQNPVLAYGGGSNAPYNQINEAIQNITTLNANFSTGPLRHQLTAGVDIAHETVDRTAYPYSPTRPSVRLLTPETNNALFLATGPANNRRETESTNLGLFLNERLWLTPQLSVYGGFRWTKFDLDYQAGTPGARPSQNYDISDSYWDPRAGVIWEPAPNQTFYYSYSTSTTPPGTFFTTFPAGAANFNNNFEPERNTNHEVGAKIGFLDNRLGVTAALFHAEKGNAFVQADDGSGDVVATGDRQRIRGAELGVTGNITPEWNIYAAYAYLDSETTRSDTPANEGRRVQYVPKHSASLWTTYDIARDTPWNVTLGAGITYRSKVFLNADNTAEVPANFSFDAMIQHKINQNLIVRVNGYNLTDRTNYEGLFGNRAIVGAGRTVLVSLAAEF